MKFRKVAIVHDWLYGGGAEMVVLELHKMFPNAPIYTSFCTDVWREKLDDQVVTGYLQHLGKFRKFLPLLRQWWFHSLDLSEYDLVISSSGNGEAKFIKTNEDTMHVCYCHSPTHFYWAKYDEYLAHPGFKPAWLARLGLKALVKPLRKRDYLASQKIDYFIANSTHIQEDIKKYYNRDSTVIFPPVDISRFNKPRNRSLERHGFMISGRQVPYKRFDIAIQACNQLKLPLLVVGDGPEHKNLQKLAGPTIKFLGRVDNDSVERAFASSEGYIFTSNEDFGISPVEALASGTPVIAYRAGGALDYIEPGINGEFFSEQACKSLIKTLKHFDSSRYNSSQIRQTSNRFSLAKFHQNIKDLLDDIPTK